MSGGDGPGRTLVLLRHAKSDWSVAGPDLERPLAERGRRQAPEAGHWLAANVPGVDLAVVSPAERARSTWALASARLAAAVRTRVDERVYAASGSELLEVVRELPDDWGTVLLVGHNPGIEELVSLLTGEHVRMPTAAIAVVALPGPWSAAGGSAATLMVCGRPPTG